ncbi:PBP1A family penicillin-binding protein [Deferribacterales bacterium Es71-Z0220]|uniref:penicillin-binding protein 1A n=1 Tax=Deferrivibrio essentukiensis TaxID=2880922 RepID=UPI001F618367|nr:PBP1A family penicillin-binding protein [Deferrivibrio essentukiensis]MCB4204218.1 PBP1A family penicillin-binding protein [Deferrivibrio essentukiensis]
MKIFKIFVVICFTIFLISSLSVLVYIYKLSSELPSIKQLKDYSYKIPTLIYDRKGRLIGELGKERRYPVKFEQIPLYLKQAVIAVEDSRFYEHGGVDFLGILRAFFTNIKAGRVVEGGSTLTQQLVKVIYLTPERKLKRKVKEAILAYKIDNYLSKDKILEIYLNEVYFGRGAYGVEAAARNYFGKSVSELTLSEAALIAGLPKAPGIYAPHISLKKSLVRRDHVLYRMYEEGYLTEKEYEVAKLDEIKIIPNIPDKILSAPYFIDFIRSYINDKLGLDLYDKGYKVNTTLDVDFQNIAEKAISSNLLDLSKRQGYFGVIGNMSEENIEEKINKVKYIERYGFRIVKVTDVDRKYADFVSLDNSSEDFLKGRIELIKNRWAKPYGSDIRLLDDMRKIIRNDDVIIVQKTGNGNYLLAQEPKAESALLSMIPQTGEVLSMVGGFDYSKSMFNRATQARRQVGSLFKPIVYTAALESGMNINTQILDAPVIMDTGEEGKYWKPENFEQEFYGFTTLRQALTKSRNIVTIKVAEKIGIDKIISYAKKFGITTDFQRDLSVSIGSGAISLLEMVTAFSVFPNMGEYVEPIFVKSIEDYSGNTVYEVNEQIKYQAIKPETAQIMTDTLINVVENGTGRKAKFINRFIGGKTGTTNDYKDAWFIGFLPNLTIGVWTGFDDFQSLGRLETGGRASLPAWIDYVVGVLPEVDFDVFKSTDNVSYLKVDKETSQITESIMDEFEFLPFDNSRLGMTSENSM